MIGIIIFCTYAGDVGKKIIKTVAVVHGPEIVDLGLALRPLRREPLSLLHQSIKPLVAGYAQGSFCAHLLG
jgi:hypothetical protein